MLTKVQPQMLQPFGPGLKNYLGVVNYINGNGDFELGATTGWSLFNTTLTGVIPTGSISAGASDITTFNVVNSSQLAGLYSLQVASSGTIAAGQGFISDAFTLDLEDHAQVMQLKLYYEVVSGAANLDFSGTDTNSWAMYLYDVTNSAWIQPAGVYNLIQNAGAGICTGTMQTSIDTTQYRLAILCVNSTAGASQMYFDDFFFGPQITAAGAAMSDWTPYTATLTSFTASTNTCFWRRVGDSMQISAYVILNSTVSSGMEIALPAGYSIDTAKLGQFAELGSAYANSGGVVYVGSVQSIFSPTTVSFAGPDGVGLWTSTVPFTWASTNTISFIITVPILGWSAQTVMSNDTDTRIVSARYAGTTQSLTANTPIDFDLKEWDTHNAVTTGGSWNFKAPVTGYYELHYSLFLTGSVSNFVHYWINGANIGYVDYNSTSRDGFQGTITVFLNAGDTLFIAPESTSGTLGSAYSVNFITITRVSGPATIAASETCAAKYRGNSGSAFSLTGDVDPVQTNGIVYDTHGMVTTGSAWKCTVPISGKYRLSLSCWFSSTSTDLYIWVNGVTTGEVLIYAIGSTFTTPLQIKNGTSTLQLNAGDYVQFIPSVSTTQQDSSGYGAFSIERIGN